MSGQTIEVLNTDAEARLVLADALSSRHRGHGVVDKDFATVPKGATAFGVQLLDHFVAQVYEMD
jgi:leucyl aminopeptidase